jgi:hypothetical protein
MQEAPPSLEVNTWKSFMSMKVTELEKQRTQKKQS